ncbi:response regulator [Aerosticca soli]|uniref:response regulator n=1 Tax=Aerosticca soli TaxID=2010829 RepID=UPI000F8271D2|nr:response regulator [Aerosticca soli]
MPDATLSPPLATPCPAPRVLVADDDPASRLVLVTGLERLGADVSACADGGSALAVAGATAFDLLLLDVHMPDLGACALLTALRGDPKAASRHAPAVATSAELPAHERRRLLALGFADTLAKPCDLAALGRLLAFFTASAPLLDDATALAASGDAATLEALRRLLGEELHGLLRDLDHGAGQPEEWIDRLHRLRASCGFCGASALADQAARLLARLRSGRTPAPGECAAFRGTLTGTLAALGHATPD